MNRTFTLQQQQQQQQLKSTSRCNDSVVVDNSVTEESVAKREKQEKSRNKKNLIVDDEPDITFTFRAVLVYMMKGEQQKIYHKGSNRKINAFITLLHPSNKIKFKT
jgi:hypothetical protein